MAEEPLDEAKTLSDLLGAINKLEVRNNKVLKALEQEIEQQPKSEPQPTTVSKPVTPPSSIENNTELNPVDTENIKNFQATTQNILDAFDGIQNQLQAEIREVPVVKEIEVPEITEVPVAKEVEVPEVTEVPVPKEVEVPEVTEVPVVKEVEVPEVTEVPVAKEIEVPQVTEVPVPKEVEVPEVAQQQIPTPALETTEDIFKKAPVVESTLATIPAQFSSASEDLLLSINNNLEKLETNLQKNNTFLLNSINQLIEISNNILKNLPTSISNTNNNLNNISPNNPANENFIENYRSSIRGYMAPRSSKQINTPMTPGFIT